MPTRHAVPTGVVNHVRVDVATGLATSPIAVHQCSMDGIRRKRIGARSRLYTQPNCGNAHEIGIEKITRVPRCLAGDAPIEGKVYNLIPEEAKSASEKSYASLYRGRAGVAERDYRSQRPRPRPVLRALLRQRQRRMGQAKRSRDTDQGDYHDYFEVEVSPACRWSARGRSCSASQRRRRLHHERHQLPGRQHHLRDTERHRRRNDARRRSQPRSGSMAAEALDLRDRNSRTRIRLDAQRPARTDHDRSSIQRTRRARTIRLRSLRPRSRRRRSRCRKA